MNRNADITKSTKELVLLFYNFETNDICLPPYHIPAYFRTLADLRGVDTMQSNELSVMQFLTEECERNCPSVVYAITSQHEGVSYQTQY